LYNIDQDHDYPFAYNVDDSDVSGLRDCLARLAGIGYSESVVCERLGLKDLCDLQMRALPIYRKERLAQRNPLDIAIDLFLLQGKVNAWNWTGCLTNSIMRFWRDRGPDN